MGGESCYPVKILSKQLKNRSFSTLNSITVTESKLNPPLHLPMPVCHRPEGESGKCDFLQDSQMLKVVLLLKYNQMLN